MTAWAPLPVLQSAVTVSAYETLLPVSSAPGNEIQLSLSRRQYAAAGPSERHITGIVTKNPDSEQANHTLECDVEPSDDSSRCQESLRNLCVKILISNEIVWRDNTEDTTKKGLIPIREQCYSEHETACRRIRMKSQLFGQPRFRTNECESCPSTRAHTKYFF